MSGKTLWPAIAQHKLMKAIYDKQANMVQATYNAYPDLFSCDEKLPAIYPTETDSWQPKLDPISFTLWMDTLHACFNQTEQSSFEAYRPVMDFWIEKFGWNAVRRKYMQPTYVAAFPNGAEQEKPFTLTNTMKAYLAAQDKEYSKQKYLCKPEKPRE